MVVTIHQLIMRLPRSKRRGGAAEIGTIRALGTNQKSEMQVRLKGKWDGVLLTSDIDIDMLNCINNSDLITFSAN
jgi:hypothetical protein